MSNDVFQKKTGGVFDNIFQRRLSFRDGDQPSAATLNTWAAQDAYAIDVIQSIVGDMHNQSGIRSAHFPNLVRAIGDVALLSAYPPSITGPSGTFEHTESFLTGQNILETEFVIKSITAPTSSSFVTRKFGWSTLHSDGDYFIYGNRVYLKKPLSAPIDLTYVAKLSGFDMYDANTSMIPNIAQAISESSYCSIQHDGVSTVGDGYREYTLQLPYCTQFLKKNFPAIHSNGNDYSILTISGTSATLPRYILPKQYTQDIKAEAGETIAPKLGVDGTPDRLIPFNHIWLWDWKNDQPATYTSEDKTVFGASEIQFKYIGPHTLRIRIPSGGYLLDEHGAQIDTTNSHNHSTFCLITSGSDLSRELFNIKQMVKYWDRTPLFGGSGISHINLVDNFRVAKSLVNVGSFGMNSSNGYVFSNIPGNMHPQYLERTGYQDTHPDESMKDAPNKQNGMLGHICFSTNPSEMSDALSNLLGKSVYGTGLPGSILEAHTFTSYGLFFGNFMGPRIFLKRKNNNGTIDGVNDRVVIGPDNAYTKYGGNHIEVSTFTGAGAGHGTWKLFIGSSLETGIFYDATPNGALVSNYFNTDTIWFKNDSKDMNIQVREVNATELSGLPKNAGGYGSISTNSDYEEDSHTGKFRIFELLKYITAETFQKDISAPLPYIKVIPPKTYDRRGNELRDDVSWTLTSIQIIYRDGGGNYTTLSPNLISLNKRGAISHAPADFIEATPSFPGTYAKVNLHATWLLYSHPNYRADYKADTL